MFTQQLPEAIFVAQKEFIQAMNANKDFVWWAETLVTEETAELQKAHEENEGMSQVFKEFADLVYVVAGFYNTMPADPHPLLSEEQNNNIQRIFEEAAEMAATVSQHYRIPPHLIEMAFNIVHASNMSKLDENGNPIRREDGKILKGPNYVAPDMTPVVEAWVAFCEQAKNAENAAEANEGNPDAGQSD